ncbi:MAG: DUF2147 domain-containing protein [Treponema sp.]|nr:DUF2147 domain-containing protein [Treponema sp.]
MKKVIAVLICIVCTALCFAQSDPVEGYWISIDEKNNRITAGWHVYQEDGKLFGKILSTANEPRGLKADRCKESYNGFPIAGKVNQMPLDGTPWIYSLTRNKPGEWSGGSIINPEDGNHYKCKITFRPADGKKYKSDTLEMRGEIGLGIGRSQFWRKSDLETASNLWPD